MPDKARENFYLAALREALPSFPSGNVLSSETPDFLVESAWTTIGLEFTLFHLPPPAGEKPHQERQALKLRRGSLRGPRSFTTRPTVPRCT